MLDAHRARERRGRGARQPHRRVAGLGRLGQLLRQAGTAARSTASTTPRQPGSALKPFTYAAAFERGYPSGHVCWPTCRRSSRRPKPGVLYSPQNYDGQFRGPLLVRAALAGSENVPAVALASEIGVPAVRAAAAPRGLHDARSQRRRTTASGLTLGNAEVRLDELVRGVCDVRARRRIDRAAIRSAASTAPSGAAAVRARSSPSARRSGSPTSSRTPKRARTSSAAAAVSNSRSPSRRRPARRRRTTTTGRSGTRVRSRSASGSATSIARRCANSSGVTGAGPIFHDVMLAAVERTRGALPIGEHAASSPCHPTCGGSSSARIRGWHQTPRARRAPSNGCRWTPRPTAAPGTTRATAVWSPSGRRRTSAGRKATTSSSVDPRRSVAAPHRPRRRRLVRRPLQRP